MKAKPEPRRRTAEATYQAVRVYVEGGGSSRAEQARLRESFTKLFRAALGDLPAPRTIACGGRGQAFDEFRAGLAGNPGSLCILLVDSEAPVKHTDDPWGHVRSRTGDAWQKPEGVTAEQLHFMVETMETWIVADPDALRREYGPQLDTGALPGTDLETVSRHDLLQKIARALRNTKKEYSKSTGLVLIGSVTPGRLEAACPHAARFFGSLRRACGALPQHASPRRPGA